MALSLFKLLSRVFIFLLLSPVGFLTKLAHLIPLPSVKIKHTDEFSPPPGKGVKWDIEKTNKIEQEENMTENLLYYLHLKGDFFYDKATLNSFFKILVNNGERLF